MIRRKLPWRSSRAIRMQGVSLVSTVRLTPTPVEEEEEEASECDPTIIGWLDNWSCFTSNGWGLYAIFSPQSNTEELCVDYDWTHLTMSASDGDAGFDFGWTYTDEMELETDRDSTLKVEHHFDPAGSSDVDLSAAVGIHFELTAVDLDDPDNDSVVVSFVFESSGGSVKKSMTIYDGDTGLYCWPWDDFSVVSGTIDWAAITNWYIEAEFTVSGKSTFRLGEIYLYQ